MKKNPIYVPITMRALLIGNLDKQSFADISDDYSLLALEPQGTFVPRQGMSTIKTIEKGVHLHWSLPDALTNGQQDDEKGDVVYPQLPNRWKVTRTWSKGKNDENIYRKSWIVESDAISFYSGENHFNSGSSTRPNLNTFSNSQIYYYQGRAYSSKFTPPETEYCESLTVIAPQNPIFTAYYPDCRNIFGIYDDMTSEDGEPIATNCHLTYTVCGWYSDYEDDPLNKITDIGQVEDSLQWKLNEETFAGFPARTICHAMITEIEWKGFDAEYPVDTGENPVLAIGNNSNEAIAALEKKQQGGEQLFLHLLSGTHDIRNGDSPIKELENELHSKRFQRVNPERQIELKPISKEKPISDELMNMADTLNELYDKEFKLRCQYEQSCQEIYELWYRRIRFRLAEKRKQALLCENLVHDYKKNHMHLKESLIDLNKDIEACEYKLSFDCKEKANISSISGASYYAPNDIVLLLSGIQRDNRHGEDWRYGNGDHHTGTLNVRGECITSLTVQPIEGLLDNPQTVFGAELLPNNLQNDSYADFILAESLLLSTSFAPQIAIKLLTKDKKDLEEEKIEKLSEQVKKLQSIPLLFKNEPNLFASAGMDKPYPAAISVHHWKQPWEPLYINWGILYQGDVKVLENSPKLDNWKRDGNDFRYLRNSDEIDICTVLGQNVITPHAAYNAEEMALRALGKSYNLSSLSSLSQNLSGLNDRLLMSENGLNMPFYTEGDKFSEMIKDLIGGYIPKHPVFNIMFSPIRAGFMSLSSLSLIDAFGQVKKLDTTGYYVADSLREGKSPFQQKVMLPPRIIQHSKISFKWFKGDSTVCAWLMPNLADKNLTVFDANGIMLGSLQTVSGETPVVWNNPPGQGISPVLPDKIDKDLYSFLNEILQYARNYNINVLIKLLGLIRECQKSTMPSSQNYMASFTDYLGKPVALCTASAQISTLLPISKYKSFIPSNVPKDIPKIENTKFPIYLGQESNANDGTIGFFYDKDYTALYSGKASENNEYIRKDSKIHLSLGDEKATDLTFIFDPTGYISADSGIMPVEAIKLNPDYVKTSLDKLFHYIFAAQLLLDPDNIAIPVPKLEGKHWKWEYFRGRIFFPDYELKSAQQNAYFPDKEIEAYEGWLKLSNNKNKNNNKDDLSYE